MINFSSLKFLHSYVHNRLYHSSSMSYGSQTVLVIWISEMQMISLCQFIKWHPLKDFPTLVFQNFGMISLSIYLIHVKICSVNLLNQPHCTCRYYCLTCYFTFSLILRNSAILRKSEDYFRKNLCF